MLLNTNLVSEIMLKSKKITMKLADVEDSLAKEAHEEWKALGED